MKRFGKVVSIVIVVSVLLCCFPGVGVVAEEVDATEQDWTGYTPISTPAELDAIRENLSGKFYLTQDIVFTDEDFAEGGEFYNNGSGWEPIGAGEDTPFTGVFDGNNHTISGLLSNMVSAEDLYVGLFGCCQGTVHNLDLVDISVSGKITGGENVVCAGGICGYLMTGGIENCSTSGMVFAHESCVDSVDKSSAYAGGIVGKTKNSHFTACKNYAQVTACAESKAESTGGGYWSTYAYAGGIVSSTSGIIEKSYNTGEISANVTGVHATSSAGGLAVSAGNVFTSYNTGDVQAKGSLNNRAGGIVSGTSGTISKCYNTGSITSSGDVGGAAAYFSSGAITEFYNVGNLEGGGTSYVGGVIGYADGGTIKESYYLNTISKGVGRGSDTTVPCSFVELMDAHTFKEFDFDLNWHMDNSSGHPFPALKGLPHATVMKPDNTTEFAGGSGYILDPYEISTKDHLNNVRKYPNAHYILVNDIVFSADDFSEDGLFYNDGAGFEPIGTSGSPFTGSFNGNGKVIDGLYVNIDSMRDTVAAGLFGYNNGTIRELGMVNSQISAYVRMNEPNSYNGDAYAGGIVGYDRGLIEKCYNTGNVSAVNELGGVYAGGISGSSETIRNCFNAGDIQAQGKGTFFATCAGGIVASIDGVVESCYNVGCVSAVGDILNTGGIVGKISFWYPTNHTSLISNCYFLNTAISAELAEDSAQAVSCLDEEMRNMDTFAGFDFDAVWTMVGDADYPYPKLQGQSIDFLCVDEDNDAFCDRCGQSLSHRCVDEDGDYICDQCNSILEHECVDANGDYWCDVETCEEWISHDCIDEDVDYQCDLCNLTLTHECVDDDNDYYCDYCYSLMPHKCINNNDDDWCDICHDWFIPCIDEDGDFQCDDCGDWMEHDCYDNDSDGLCDVCHQEYNVRIVGDINGDGRVNIIDVAKLYACVKGTGSLDDCLSYCDISGDGRVNIIDVAQLYAHVKVGGTI